MTSSMVRKGMTPGSAFNPQKQNLTIQGISKTLYSKFVKLVFVNGHLSEYQRQKHFKKTNDHKEVKKKLKLAVNILYGRV